MNWKLKVASLGASSVAFFWESVRWTLTSLDSSEYKAGLRGELSKLYGEHGKHSRRQIQPPFCNPTIQIERQIIVSLEMETLGDLT